MTENVLRDVVVFLQSRSWRDVIDILVVAFLAYRLLVLIRGTRAVQLIAGLSVLVLVGLISKALRLQLTYYIFSNLAPALLIGVVILFQPELRRALDRVGRVGFIGRPLAHYSLPLMAKVIDDNGHSYALFGGGLLGFEIGAGLAARKQAGVTILDHSPALELLVDDGGEFGDGVDGVVGDVELHAFSFEEGDVLLDERVLGFGENADEVFFL